MMDNCPKCGHGDIQCWDDTTIQWWQPDGSPSGVQQATSMACADCGYAWVDLDPANEVMEHDGAYPDYADERRVFG